MWKCEVCGESDYLVMQFSVADMVCENCGAWQDAEFNSAWVRVS